MTLSFRFVFTVFMISSMLCWTTPVSSEEMPNLLDGKRFVGTNGEKGQQLDPDEHEEIVFENGVFRSLGCEPYEFGSAEYVTERVGDTIHFEAVTVSPTHGKISWKGVVDGEQAKVDFVWTKERWYWDTHREYWFQGTLKK